MIYLMDSIEYPHVANEITGGTVDDMKVQKMKVTKVGDILDRIHEHRARIKEDTKELRGLEGHPIQDSNPRPADFEYKTAIQNVFDKANTPMNLDAIVAALNEKYGFVPDRTIVAIRVGYLADSAKPPKLERVTNRRGFYRLSSYATKAHDTSSG